jgi:bifunctional ADP-heptose synthase (sugar kinase/adenylyltransferase)
MVLGNLAASLVVGRFGTAAAPEEMKAASQALLDEEEISS